MLIKTYPSHKKKMLIKTKSLYQRSHKIRTRNQIDEFQGQSLRGNPQSRDEVFQRRSSQISLHGVVFVGALDQARPRFFRRRFGTTCVCRLGLGLFRRALLIDTFLVFFFFVPRRRFILEGTSFNFFCLALFHHFFLC